MGLSNDLISQFVKSTKDENKTKNDSTMYATIVKRGDEYFARLDGANEQVLTPIVTVVEVADGDRVTVVIRNHEAIVTGNKTSPAVRSDTFTETVKLVSSDILAINSEIEAHNSSIKNIDTEISNVKSNISNVESDISNVKSNISNVESDIKNIDTDISNVESDISNVKTNISNIESDIKTVNSDIETVNSEVDIINSAIEIKDGVVTGIKGADTEWIKTEDLQADHATIKDLDVNYANIDFANIGKAAVEKLFAETAKIVELTGQNAFITGELVAVTFKGDLIQGGTVVADKLILKGEDGIYYKMNYESGALTGEEAWEGVYYKVTYNSETEEYTVTEETVEEPEGVALENTYTTDLRKVYQATDDSGNTFYYCMGYPEWADNALHGKVIVAKSVTADKIHVTDLNAFGATIGQFHIGDSSIYSGVKSSIDSDIRGIYQDIEGQFAVGDGNRHIKYYQEKFLRKVEYDSTNSVYVSTDVEFAFTDNIPEGELIVNDDESVIKTTSGDNVYSTTSTDGTVLYYYIKYGDYKLEIFADSVFFGSSKDSAADIKKLTEHVKIETYEDPETGDNKPCIELAEGDSDFKQIITNTKTIFTDGSTEGTTISIDGVKTDNVTVDGELRHGNWLWSERKNGDYYNYGLIWKGGAE